MCQDVVSLLTNPCVGCSFFFGGLYHKTQTFNAVGNRACSSLLMLSCIGVILPTAFTVLTNQDEIKDEYILDMSRGTAVLLLIGYVGGGGAA